MTLVAVTQRTCVIGQFGEIRDTLDQRLTGWLHRCGLLAVPIPNLVAAVGTGSDVSLGCWINEVSPQGLVLSGGDDLKTDQDRDELELCLLDLAGSLSLPVLGICRGMQMMATRAGSPLVEVPGHVGVRHQISGEMTGEVNSFHYYGMVDAPDGYVVTARSTDGVVEGIRHTELPWEGWMWHPERDELTSEVCAARLRSLFSLGRPMDRREE